MTLYNLIFVICIQGQTCFTHLTMTAQGSGVPLSVSQSECEVNGRTMVDSAPDTIKGYWCVERK